MQTSDGKKRYRVNVSDLFSPVYNLINLLSHGWLVQCPLFHAPANAKHRTWRMCEWTIGQITGFIAEAERSWRLLTLLCEGCYSGAISASDNSAGSMQDPSMHVQVVVSPVLLSSTYSDETTCGVDSESVRFRFRYFSQTQIWTLAASKSPVSSVKYQDEKITDSLDIDCITGLDTGDNLLSPVSISIGHWRFNYCRCPNLNLKEISESEANSTHLIVSGCSL